MSETLEIEIPLTQGKVAIIDAVDLNLIAGYKWYYFKCRSTSYARAYIRGTYEYLGNGKGTGESVLMHRLILTGQADQDTDHIDRDGLNNRRSNLRVATRSQNMANSKLFKNNTSGYRGVSWHEQSNAYVAQVYHNYKKYFLGVFKDPEDAARAYDRAAGEHFGDFARLNFP